MLLHNGIPQFNIGDWVEINSRCLIGQYIGRIVQIIDIEDAVTLYGRNEYVCKITDDHDQVFWEVELTLSKVIPINGGTLQKSIDAEKEDKEDEEKPKVIWV